MVGATADCRRDRRGSPRSRPEARDTVFYLYVDGIGQGVGGHDELEVSRNKGDCEDPPVPIFVDPGSPVLAPVGTKNARNVMTHSCGVSGTAEVIDFDPTSADPP
jgi:hypothetical protein